MRKRLCSASAVLVLTFLLSQPCLAWSRARGISFSTSSGHPVISDDAPHYLLWHDGDSWHLRWESVEKRRRFSGELRATGGSITLTKRVNLEKKDKTKVHDPDTIVFKAKVKGGPEGFDFRWTGKYLVVDLYIGDEHRPNKVYVGRRALRPNTIPFELTGNSYARDKVLSSVAWGMPHTEQKEPHYLLWQDGDSWHLRWESHKGKGRFSGEVKSIEGSMELVRRVNLEKRDKTKVHAPDTITFKAKVKGGPEGFDFRWTGTKLMVDIEVEGEKLPGRIYVGRQAVIPSKLPFYIVKGNYSVPPSPRRWPPRPRKRYIHRPPPSELPPPFRHIPPQGR